VLYDLKPTILIHSSKVGIRITEVEKNLEGEFSFLRKKFSLNSMLAA